MVNDAQGACQPAGGNEKVVCAHAKQPTSGSCEHGDLLKKLQVYQEGKRCDCHRAERIIILRESGD